MSKYQITSTTDGRYIGQEFDSADTVIVLSKDVQVGVERVIPLPDGVRIVNSNYVIDAKEV